MSDSQPLKDRAPLELLLGEFMHHLAHTLRTPLSVMANDLHYLSVRTTGQPIDSWKEALTRITRQLDEITAYQAGNMSNPQFTVGELLQQLFLPTGTLGRNAELIIAGDINSLTHALREIFLLNQRETPPAFELSSESRQLTLILKTHETNLNGHHNHFTTTRFSLNPADPPLTLWLAELVLRSAGAEFCTRAGTLMIKLKLNEYASDSGS